MMVGQISEETEVSLIEPGLRYSRVLCEYSKHMGNPRRYRRSLNHKLCRLGIGRCYYFDPFGTLREIKVFGFWGEYGRKAET